MFVGKNPDGSIYGMWTNPQPNDADHPNVTEMPDDDPAIIAVLKRVIPQGDTVQSLKAQLVAKGVL